MRVKKIRGHKHIWKRIDQWVNQRKILDVETLAYYQRDYVKIYIHPWSSISMLNSSVVEPKGKTRKKILEGLITIYEAWELQLKELGVPYYLKIWLYEPHFSNSQVVCAIGDHIDFYEITFHRPEETKQLNLNNFGNLSSKMAEFDWEFRINETHLSDTEIGSPDDYYNIEDYNQELAWFNKMLTKKHRVTISNDPRVDAKEYYSFKIGAVWLGGKK